MGSHSIGWSICFNNRIIFNESQIVDNLNEFNERVL